MATKLTPKSYLVTKHFTGGLLKGLTIEETTSVKFEIGFKCPKPCAGSPYIIKNVVEIK